MDQSYILETQNLTKDFEGFVAVDGVDLKVREGTIQALIGLNGSELHAFYGEPHILYDESEQR